MRLLSMLALHPSNIVWRRAMCDDVSWAMQVAKCPVIVEPVPSSTMIDACRNGWDVDAWLGEAISWA